MLSLSSTFMAGLERCRWCIIHFHLLKFGVLSTRRGREVGAQCQKPTNSATSRTASRLRCPWHSAVTSRISEARHLYIVSCHRSIHRQSLSLATYHYPTTRQNAQPQNFTRQTVRCQPVRSYSSLASPHNSLAATSRHRRRRARDGRFRSYLRRRPQFVISGD